MSTGRRPDLGRAPDAFIASVVDRMASDQPIRRLVPSGWLHIDRMLPFLFAYRHPPDRVVEGIDRLVHSQASYLSVSGERHLGAAVGALVRAIGDCVIERLGSFLVVELWPAPQSGPFRVVAPATEPATTVTTLTKALVDIDVLGGSATVETGTSPAPCPPNMGPLLSPEDLRRHGALLVGLEIPMFFADSRGASLPLVLRRLQHELSRALQRTAFEFATVQTSLKPEDFRALGQRQLSAATRRADRRLAKVGGMVDHLLAVTPIDADAAWMAFRDGGFRTEPSFHYRPLSVDPDLLKRSIYDVALEDVDDPALAALFRAKRRELDRQFSLLEDRGSAAFLHGSLQLYGGVDPDLLALAEELFCRLGADGRADDETEPRRYVDAPALAHRARAELARYGAGVAGGFDSTATVRDDVPGVMVSGGDLLIGRDVRVSAARVDAVIEHEIGTHVVTTANGRAQKLHLLRVGLPGYEETQEALALLAEFVAGGLTAQRLETLAARVVAVHCLIGGATFVETFGVLRRRHGLAPGRAFDVAMRVHRSGGLTKDAIYLRGIDRLFGYLAEGKSLDPLLVGKLAIEHVPVIEELQWREVLTPPRLRPRWLDRADTADRIDAVRKGMTVLDLVPQRQQ